MPWVQIPAGTATTTGDSANVMFFDASANGNRIRNLYTIGTDGQPGTLVANGVVVIGATSGAYGPFLAETNANVIYFEDTTGTRSAVAWNYKPFKVTQRTILTKNANTTLADTQLSFYGVANAVYNVFVTADVAATSGTPDCKFQWTVPSGATALTTGLPDLGVGAAGTAVAGVAANADYVRGTLNGTTTIGFRTKVTIGSTAGTVTLKFAQNTSDASDTSFAVGSQAIVDRVS